MVVSDLRKDHPQKYFMKFTCKLLYYMGMGDYWYEETKRSRTHKVFYAIWAGTFNGYLILNTINELLANIRTDLTTKEKNDLIQFSMAHPALSAKFIFLILQKNRVKVLLKRMLEGDSSTFRSLKDERKSVMKSIWYFIALLFVSYGTLGMSTVDTYVAHKKEGIPFDMEVTLIPTRSQTGLFASILKVLIEVHWWSLVTNMILVDGMSFTCLTYLEIKFKLVSMYFDELRAKTKRNLKTKSEKECAEEFEKDFVTGIKIHAEALWCSKYVQQSLGKIYGVQIIESITLLAICLIKLVTFERNMTFLVANGLYISCLLTLNGAYMMEAGDVTYEASVVPTSMFHCGWELVQVSRQFRALAVVAVVNSQRPVHMTAFGVITMSHRNFITDYEGQIAVAIITTQECPRNRYECDDKLLDFAALYLMKYVNNQVIRSSYSFFAVMY